MNYKTVINIIGIILIILSIFMIIPILVSIINHSSDIPALGLSCFLTFFCGTVMLALTKQYRHEELMYREAFMTVTLTWIAVAFFGCLPYIFTGSVSSFTDAFFEAMSGFTTTGASIFADVESLPAGLLFWRSMTQWIGGMGIIVFVLAVLPLMGIGGMQLFKAEVPEISVDKLRPRIIDTAKSLWFIYIGITAIIIILYFIAGMDIYDAVCHAFTTISTGGFSTKNASIAHFKSPMLEYISSFGMFLGGINFALYFYLLKGRVRRFLKNAEFRFYFCIISITVVLLTVDLLFYYHSFSEAFRYALFQVISIMTTTGYATADYLKWSSFSQLVLLIIMFFGGMIGSTGGGIKQVRVYLMIKQIYREFYQLIHPRAVLALKLDDKFLTKEILGSIWGFVFLAIFVCALASIGMTATGLDMVTSVSTVVSSMNNVGPALGEAGPAGNYFSIHPLGKWILILCMLAGRLEYYTVLILLTPAFWKR
ncbi:MULTISPECIES: TrkH family potassium uptake protein [Thermodesulfovibrio]|jgi:trk system potassium uptake protein TrkH|uniref:TrkH family potassium uptake protein n=1 Tax=Thermodesulfovibrio TaxID=28261 RepID=UPI001144D8A0|nr:MULTISPECIES: TrkH family potassium uptake protein [Thermodesulfovibrio]MDI6864465.1 TrkH family potassium uptake protein [Thermodesulfovibrio yellowstonii]